MTVAKKGCLCRDEDTKHGFSNRRRVNLAKYWTCICDLSNNVIINFYSRGGQSVDVFLFAYLLSDTT